MFFSNKSNILNETSCPFAMNKTKIIRPFLRPTINLLMSIQCQTETTCHDISAAICFELLMRLSCTFFLNLFV